MNMQINIFHALTEVEAARSELYAIALMARGLESINDCKAVSSVVTHTLNHLIVIEDTLSELHSEITKDSTNTAEPEELPFVEPKTKKKKEATPRKKVDHGKIIALHKAGWSGAKIADEMGCSQGVVSTHIKTAREKGEL